VDATWQAGCSDGTGHAGWEAAQATARFVTADPETVTIGNIDSFAVTPRMDEA
jgi:hypothetical protein